MDQLSSSTLGALAVSLLTGLIIIYHLKKFTFWSSRGVVGPMPWPIFGTNIYYLFRSKLEVDANWRTKYGKVYGIYEGYAPTLRVMDNELIKHIYIKEFSSFTDRNSRAIHGDNAKRWLLWSKGTYWSNQRAMVSPMFTSSKMRSMFDTMSNCIENFLNETNLQITSKLNGQGQGIADKTESILKSANGTTFVRQDLMNLTLDVIAQSFFSIKLNTYRDNNNEFLRQAYKFSRADFGRLLLWLLTPNPIARYFKIDLIPYSRYRYFDELSQSVIDKRRRYQKNATQSQDFKAKVDKKFNDLIQAFLDAKIADNYEKIYTEEDDQLAHYNDQIKHDELEKIQQIQTKEAKHFRHFDDAEICGSMTFLFLAGFDTTASTMNFCLYELAHQQSIQEEIYQELIETLNVEDELAGKQQLDYTKLFGLIKLDAFVSEILRLYSVLVENNRRVTIKQGLLLPLSSKAIPLPYGTAISTNFFVLQRDPDYFDRPSEFDMTRFYPENRDKIKSCTYMPFGVGPRNCAGMRFALLEIKLFVAKVLLRYSIWPGPNSLNYPPKFEHNMIFLEFKNTDFKLIPRLS